MFFGEFSFLLPVLPSTVAIGWLYLGKGGEGSLTDEGKSVRAAFQSHVAKRWGYVPPVKVAALTEAPETLTCWFWASQQVQIRMVEEGVIKWEEITRCDDRDCEPCRGIEIRFAGKTKFKSQDERINELKFKVQSLAKESAGNSRDHVRAMRQLAEARADYSRVHEKYMAVLKGTNTVNETRTDKTGCCEHCARTMPCRAVMIGSNRRWLCMPCYSNTRQAYKPGTVRFDEMHEICVDEKALPVARYHSNFVSRPIRKEISA